MRGNGIDLSLGIVNGYDDDYDDDEMMKCFLMCE